MKDNQKKCKDHNLNPNLTKTIKPKITIISENDRGGINPLKGSIANIQYDLVKLSENLNYCISGIGGRNSAF